MFVGIGRIKSFLVGIDSLEEAHVSGMFQFEHVCTFEVQGFILHKIHVLIEVVRDGGGLAGVGERMEDGRLGLHQSKLRDFDFHVDCLICGNSRKVGSKNYPSQQLHQARRSGACTSLTQSLNFFIDPG